MEINFTQMANLFRQNNFRTILLSGFFIWSASPLFAQVLPEHAHGNPPFFYIENKCGDYDKSAALERLSIMGDHWGYSYDSLLSDLEIWGQSPYVTIDSLGASVQDRAIWQLTVTSDNPPTEPRRTVFIHARTHPSEVQAFWVTDEIINFLRSENGFAQLLRENCVFYILPMYNPDGVELEHPRENANDIDIESNWGTFPPEAEVAVLRSRFVELMASDAPIEIALNMHSAFACKRYFVYHDEVGTSYDYTVLEKQFIASVRDEFVPGIEPWDYFVSWTSGTPDKYPESWFWNNHQEAVMALTYEDMNCSAAGDYDLTALAILNGIADYLGLNMTAATEKNKRDIDFTLHQNFPNPVIWSQNPSLFTTVKYELETPQNIRLSLFDSGGGLVKTVENGFRSAGLHEVYFDMAGLAGGLYFYQLETPGGVKNRRLVLIK